MNFFFQTLINSSLTKFISFFLLIRPNIKVNNTYLCLFIYCKYILFKKKNCLVFYDFFLILSLFEWDIMSLIYIYMQK